jgi:pantetheine-phosphate adenylyltransferase
MTIERVGVYPGTFDPTTLGHSDIIRRATRLVDRLIVAVAVNAGKGPMFSLDERIEMVRDETADLDCATVIEVAPLTTLLMTFVRQSGAQIIVRGLRAVSDFDYEFQMTGMNARLDPTVETVFLMASGDHQFISSRFVKEIAQLDGDVSGFVPPRVLERLSARLAEGE